MQFASCGGYSAAPSCYRRIVSASDVSAFREVFCRDILRDVSANPGRQARLFSISCLRRTVFFPRTRNWSQEDTLHLQVIILLSSESIRISDLSAFREAFCRDILRDVSANPGRQARLFSETSPAAGGQRSSRGPGTGPRRIRCISKLLSYYRRRVSVYRIYRHFARRSAEIFCGMSLQTQVVKPDYLFSISCLRRTVFFPRTRNWSQEDTLHLQVIILLSSESIRISDLSVFREAFCRDILRDGKERV